MWFSWINADVFHNVWESRDVSVDLWVSAAALVAMWVSAGVFYGFLGVHLCACVLLVERRTGVVSMWEH